MESENPYNIEQKEITAFEEVFAAFLYYPFYFEDKLVNKRLKKIDSLRAKQRMTLVTAGEIEALIDKKRTEYHSDFPSFQLERLESAIHMVVRDWSSEGAEERKLTYSPVLHVLESFFHSIKKEDRFQIKVLVPGAGLARLAYEIAILNFWTQGNEFSFMMV
ncbi:hypothetical protein BB560_000991 [Smittium megazygosporum]|uniref:Uncharacterized protein n=1 Tax=Smittium megazygosporum TaxID=133381 RepID=A0A2T9ZJ20_9FUNG|nr:hypothetical protein BB560_000991 [Smittium megazygosporum]